MTAPSRTFLGTGNGLLLFPAVQVDHSAVHGTGYFQLLTVAGRRLRQPHTGQHYCGKAVSKPLAADHRDGCIHGAFCRYLMVRKPKKAAANAVAAPVEAPATAATVPEGEPTKADGDTN